MFRITETAGTISHADYLSALDLGSKVALLNVNYRRPYWEVTLAEVSLLSCSAAPVVLTTSVNLHDDKQQRRAIHSWGSCMRGNFTMAVCNVQARFQKIQKSRIRLPRLCGPRCISVHNTLQFFTQEQWQCRLHASLIVWKYMLSPSPWQRHRFGLLCGLHRYSVNTGNQGRTNHSGTPYKRKAAAPTAPSCGILAVKQYQKGRKRLEIFADGTTSPTPPCSHGPLRSAVTQLFRWGPRFFPGVGKLGNERPPGGPEAEPRVWGEDLRSWRYVLNIMHKYFVYWDFRQNLLFWLCPFLTSTL